MRLLPTLLAAAMAAACGAASAQAGSAPQNHGTAGPQAPQAQPMERQAAGTAQRQSRQLSDADKDFVENAAQSGLAEVQASKMAEKRATNPQVRQFAQKMVKDHTAANQKLMQIAKASGAEVPKDPSILQRGKLELLEHSRDEFDARYIDHMGVDAHKNAIEVFQREVMEGKDQQLVKFARDTLPKLQEHLRMAQDLQGTLQARGEHKDDTKASGAGRASDRSDQKADMGKAGSGSGTAVQTQSSRVTDTGVAPPAVDQRTPAKPAQR